MRSPVRSGLGFVAVLLALFCSTSPSFAQGRCVMPVARVVDSEGAVSVPGPQIINIAAGSQLDLCAGETVATGPRSRATVTLLSSNQTFRINQNTTVRIVGEMPQAPRSVIELLQGIIRLFNPIGRPLDVRTPFVTAGTEGTEFFVAYDPQTEETRAGVIEGLVRITRNGDSLLLDAGQAAVAPRVGPLQRLDIVPSDAVRWSIFYPPAMWSLPPQEEMALDPRVARAWQAWRTGNLQEFVAQLNAVPPILPPPAAVPLDARSLLRLAALLLIVGQVEEAEAAVAQAALTNATAPMIPALRAIIAVARNRTDEALALSDVAVVASRQGGDQAALIGAAIARSYALQSAFRLPEARAILATVDTAEDPLVLARLAELDLSLGDNRAARREAQRANQLAPSLSLTSSILGFAALANFDFAAAGTAFARAAAQSPGDPLPHLGLGLVAIRSGNFFSFSSRNLEEGRRELVIAVALNPENSVARSYLGRTYAGLRLYPDAFREWALAESADPNDPTAPLYRAFAERALNRPIAALEDIQRSIALNDNRAVYRSRLLLDQDLATRATDLASVYRDLGFDQLALSEAYRSLDTDPGNPGGHRFLSDTYLALAGHEAASDSELLQSLLLQPINVQPLRPRLAREGLGVIDLQGPSRIGFNEFSPVFASNGLNILADAFGGTQGTYGDNLVLSGIYNKFSISAGQFYYRTDGFRANNDVRRNIENVFVQTALSDRASLLFEYRHSARAEGDTSFLFDPNYFSDVVRGDSNLSQYRVGGRFDIAPRATAVAVWTRENLADDYSDPGAGNQIDYDFTGDFFEGATYISLGRANVVVGGGYFAGDRKVTINDVYLPFPIIDETDDTHSNAWIYLNANPLGELNVTLGGSFDSYRGTLEHDRLSPKIGISWANILPSVTFRAAYFETVKRRFVGGQTIEPTHIVGFNQLYDDVNLSHTKRWGFGLDAKFSTRVFAGIEWTRREIQIPVLGVFSEEASRHTIMRSYLDWIVTDRVSLNAAPQWERLVGDPTGLTFFDDLSLFKLPVQVRYHHPSGLFALLGTTFVHEDGDFFQFDGTPFHGRESFAVVDAGIGWRLPGRGLIASLQVANLFNSGFRFQDTTIDRPTLFPSRVVSARLTFSF